MGVVIDKCLLVSRTKVRTPCVLKGREYDRQLTADILQCRCMPFEDWRIKLSELAAVNRQLAANVVS